MKAGSIKLVIESRLESAALVRAALRGLCGSDVGEKTVAAIELAASEAVNNCVKHAYADRKGEEITVEYSMQPGRLELIVSDRGRTMDVRLLWRANRSMLGVDPSHPDGLRSSGRGLALIKESMDSVEYHSSGGCNRLVMVKRLGNEDRKA